MAFDASKGFLKAYDLYKEVFQNSPQFTSYNDIKYFVYANKYMLKTQKINCEEFLENYELLSGICDQNISNNVKADKYLELIIGIDIPKFMPVFNNPLSSIMIFDSV